MSTQAGRKPPFAELRQRRDRAQFMVQEIYRARQTNGTTETAVMMMKMMQMILGF
jgi:hypothetical protein